jgi:hypothetical protein
MSVSRVFPHPPRIVARSLVLLAALLVALGAGLVQPATPASAIVLARDISLPAPGPLGPVTVFGDSVLLGSALYSPTLPDRLQEQGWGPILFRAGVGNRAGPAGNATTAGYWIRAWRSQGWDAPNVIVNLGANDSGVCGTDSACARRRILDVVDEIGPGHRIWWPMITQHPRYRSSADAWNRALSELAAERNDFFTWDWPTELATGGYSTNDFIHLDPSGYRKRSQRMAAAFTAALARAERTGRDAALPAPSAAASRYVPLAPVRIVDTRTDAPGRRPDNSQLVVDFADRLPPGTTAVAINVTAAGPGADGYLAAGPCGRPINASTVNFTRLTERAAMTVSPLGDDGRICVANRGDTDVIVDLQGAFVDDTAAAGFTPLAQNRRLVDTRATGRSRVLVVPTPPGATAVAVNLTVVNADTPGFLRATPCGSTVDVSSVNYQAVEAVAGSAYVTTSAQGTICVETSTPADVIVDLTGQFGDGGLSYVPVAPTRMLDTRNAVGGWSPIHGPGQTLDIRVAPPEARAVIGTLTIVNPTRAGFLVAHACGPLPPTASVNAAGGLALANSLTTGVSSDGRLCVYADPMTHSLFDATGWWIP